MQTGGSDTNTIMSGTVQKASALQAVPPAFLLEQEALWMQELVKQVSHVVIAIKKQVITIYVTPQDGRSVWEQVVGIHALDKELAFVEVVVKTKRDVSDSEQQDMCLRACLWLLTMRDKALKPMLDQAFFQFENLNRVSLSLSSPVELAMQRALDRKLSSLFLSLTGQVINVQLAQTAEKDDLVQEFRTSMEQETHDALQKQIVVSDVKESLAQNPPRLQFGNVIEDSPIDIQQIQDEMRSVTVTGRVFGLEIRELNSGRQLIQFHVTDETDSITCKVFLRGQGKKEQDVSALQDGVHVIVRGSVQFDTYMKELALLITDMTSYESEKRLDTATRKRVELHAHTQMSTLDGVVSATDLVRQAAEFGHEAVAITDHGVVQSYPEAASAGKKYGVKILYGIEANMIDAGQTIVYRATEQRLDDRTTYVVFDTETTGLSAAEHELIEIAGVKMCGGAIIDSFSQLIHPKQMISAKITEITGITNDMVRDEPSVAEVLPRFQAFCKDAILVAHNAEFDLSFLDVQAKILEMTAFEQPTIDTLALARTLFPQDRNHRLKTLTQKWDISLVNHHRALADAEATGKVFYKLLETARERTVIDHLQHLVKFGFSSTDFTKGRPYHTTILVTSPIGLKNMYKLVSFSHLDYFYREPRMVRKLIQEHREGLLIGTGCKLGEIFQAILRGKSRTDLVSMLRFYDFVEIQPPDHYQALLASEEISSLDQVMHYHRYLVELADEVGIPVVATGDVHFLQPKDAVFREIILQSSMKKETSRIVQPALTFKTTQDMLEAFAHLGDRTQEVVVDNPLRIAERIESISPVPDRVYPPNMEGAEDQVRSLSYQKVHQLYGETLPTVVSERLEKEVTSIITHGFSVNYLIAHKLVTKSLQDGYIVGSRGSVGSSLVATLMDITEVNPLPPHYLCHSCKFSEFILDGTIGSGFDLPDKMCPNCNTPLKKDGQDIPFETFLGFKGDKVPDIDLNFSGEYQARAHKYTEELFGSDFVFRAGTISTIAEKTAFGYVKKWAEERGKQLRNAEIARLVAGCTGIKRTTGQHPGGLIIVPNDHEIYDFCPIQHPADDRTTDTRTTHFDFHSIHDNLLKLDILGHDDPTMLRMLQDITGIDTRSVPVDDKDVYALFCGTESLGVTTQQIKSKTGTYGIPEFGTKFVRQMLEDTKPSTFADLVRISGLSHGTDVWLNNAQELIRQGTATLSDVICCRDDIMVYLIYRGLDPSRAFKIMESVRKGKGLSDDDEQYMRSFHVKDWYMESCRRIKYMFPKAHAAAYVLNAVRIAYFKVHYPLAYYAAYFTVRAEDFDLALMARGADAIAARIDEIEAKQMTATTKEKALQTVLEVALEMTRRGFRFYGLDLYASDSTRFLVKEDGLLPPFAAASGIGAAAASNMVSARKEAEFLSIEDLQERSHVSKTVIELLQGYGCFDGLPESNQLSLF